MGLLAAWSLPADPTLVVTNAGLVALMVWLLRAARDDRYDRP